MRRPPTTFWFFLLAFPLFSTLLSSAARAERMPGAMPRVPTAVLWIDGGTPALRSALDAQLAASTVLSPLEDAERRRVLVEGGPAGRVAAHLLAGKERFAALRELPEADAELAQAEAIAIAELPVAEACARLLDVERLRLRYAELGRDETAGMHAARLLAACAQPPSAEDAAAIARHGTRGAATAQAAARVESDPAGAEVFLDLRSIGRTPLSLPTVREPGALLDVELGGYRKVHRAAPASGTLAVGLARDDGIASLVDRIRAAAGDAPDGDLVDLGRRLGAGRLLVARRDPAPASTVRVQGRLLDVNAGRWIGVPVTIAGSDTADAAAQMVAWASGAPAASPMGAPATTAATAPPEKSPPPVSIAAKTGRGAHVAPPSPPSHATPETPAWKRWYTWAIGGALVAVIGGVFIANHIGDDQVTVHVGR